MKPSILTAPLAPAIADELRNGFDGDVLTEPHEVSLYATDASMYQIQPRAVVVPRHDADVRHAVTVAARHGIPLLPRGGGTSLSGQTIGHALIIDFSTYMDQVLELNAGERWVRVQPGVVLDALNAQLAPLGLQFAPDPATSSRANIGGMLGNNSAGTRSILYGMTADHVLDMRVILSDGTELTFAELEPEAWAARSTGLSREAQIHGAFKGILDRNRDEIATRYPKVMRRVGGYSLDAFTDGAPWNLSRLMIGSEGTLGLVLEARLHLVPLPAHSIMIVPHFESMTDAVRAVSSILPHQPAAVEVLDEEVVKPARTNPTTAPYCGFLEGNPNSVLLVQLVGDSPEKLLERANQLVDDMKAQGHGFSWPICIKSADQAKIWALRKHGLGILLSVKGERKPAAFIEDAAVPVEVLPDYVNDVLQICADHEIRAAVYAHASVGLLHIRPILDLKDAADIERMKQISRAVFERVRHYGGSWSGEHGAGMVRGAYNEEFFGSTLYQAFKDVKALFDPAGLMNPGKIIDAPPMDHHLRLGADYGTMDIPTQFHYRTQGSLSEIVHGCNGVGDCRKTLTGTMCPSYMATREEAHSTRGRANALRLAISGQWGPDGVASDAMRDVFSLCLSCKACKSECPSQVDVARMKAEVMQILHDRNGIPLRDRMVYHTPTLARLFSGFPAPAINRIQRSPLFRAGLEHVAGIDRRRVLPGFARQSLQKWFASRPVPAVSGSQTVALFADTFSDGYESAVGIAAVELLESCGYHVQLAAAGCCQRTRISKGFLREARRDGTRTLQALDKFVQQEIPILVLEPSCASALTDDLPDLVDDEEQGKRVSANVFPIGVFLDQEIEAGRLACEFRATCSSVLLHGHCHQKALGTTGAMKRILARVSGLTVTEVDSGCCGMAGAFGYEKEHFEVSMKVGERKLFPAVREASPDTTIVACGFSCRHQIRDATGAQPVHWVQIVRAGVTDA